MDNNNCRYRMVSRRHSTRFARVVSAVFLLTLIGTTSYAASDADGSDDATDILVASIDVILPSADKPKKTASGGEDKNESCAEWANAGECVSNPDYMLENCAASCSTEDDNATDDDNQANEKDVRKGRAYIYQGEDAAIGAFRFAENYSTYFKNEMIPTATVLDIARNLQTSLSNSDSEYTPPNDITHCGGDSNKKSRPCSAGKLWKRAEDFRKDDMHDAGELYFLFMKHE